jgi:hypothetical protein
VFERATPGDGIKTREIRNLTNNDRVRVKRF